MFSFSLGHSRSSNVVNSEQSNSESALGENCSELQEIKKFLQYRPTSQSQSVVSQHPLHSEVSPERVLKSRFQAYKGSHHVLKPYWLLCFVNFDSLLNPCLFHPRVWLPPRLHQSEPEKHNENCWKALYTWKRGETPITLSLSFPELSEMHRKMSHTTSFLDLGWSPVFLGNKWY